MSEYCDCGNNWRCVRVRGVKERCPCGNGKCNVDDRYCRDWFCSNFYICAYRNCCALTEVRYRRDDEEYYCAWHKCTNDECDLPRRPGGYNYCENCGCQKCDENNDNLDCDAAGLRRCWDCLNVCNEEDCECVHAEGSPYCVYHIPEDDEGRFKCNKHDCEACWFSDRWITAYFMLALDCPLPVMEAVYTKI